MDRPAAPALLDHFAALEDSRQGAKVLYPLPEILLLLLRATLAGADDLVEIELWGEENLALLRRFLPCRHGVPSHDTLGEVVAALDPELFKGCFTAWVGGLREAAPDLVAIDGKTSRRSHARDKGREPLHLVPAWATRQRLVLGQEAVGGKSNETTAIPLLLERLALDGALVTIDAIGTQSAIAATILGARWRLPPGAEGEPPGHVQGRGDVLRRPAAGRARSLETIDGERGRIETRRHAVCHDVAWLFSDRRYPGEPTFPGLAMLGMVESRSNAAARPAANGATTWDPPGSTPGPSPARPAVIGGSRTGCTGPGPGVRGRPRPPEDRPRAGEHGRGQAHGREPAAPSEADAQPASAQPGPGRPRHGPPSQLCPARGSLPAASAGSGLAGSRLGRLTCSSASPELTTPGADRWGAAARTTGR